MSALLDAISTRIQRSPRALRLLSGLARRLDPVIVVRKRVFVLGADAVREVLARASDFELGPVGAPKMLMGPFLLGMDPREQYLSERRLLGEVLTSLQPTLGKVAYDACTAAAEALEGKRSIEVVSEFAEPVVTRIAARFYGVALPMPEQTSVLRVSRGERGGEELLGQWLRKIGSVIATTSPAPFGLQRVAQACVPELEAHLQLAIERGGPPDTVLAKLLECVRRGQLPIERVLPNLAGLMLAGSTALVKSFVNALEQILQRDQKELPAQRDTDTLRALLFEALRFNPTFPMIVRFCPRATRLGEGASAREIPAGAQVYVALVAAMFDAEIGDADRFSAVRSPAGTLVFGWGQHMCLGRVIATTELVEMLRAFLSVPELLQFKGSRIRYDGPAVQSFRITHDGGGP